MLVSVRGPNATPSEESALLGGLAGDGSGFWGFVKSAVESLVSDAGNWAVKKIYEVAL